MRRFFGGRRGAISLREKFGPLLNSLLPPPGSSILTISSQSGEREREAREQTSSVSPLSKRSGTSLRFPHLLLLLHHRSRNWLAGREEDEETYAWSFCFFRSSVTFVLLRLLLRRCRNVVCCFLLLLFVRFVAASFSSVGAPFRAPPSCLLSRCPRNLFYLSVSGMPVMRPGFVALLLRAEREKEGERRKEREIYVSSYRSLPSVTSLSRGTSGPTLAWSGLPNASARALPEFHHRRNYPSPWASLRNTRSFVGNSRE